MKIALLSSASNPVSPENKKIVKAILKILLHHHVELVTGGSSGIPEFAVIEYSALGGTSTVFSPDVNEQSHSARADNIPVGIATRYVYHEGFNLRSAKMLQYVDGAIVLNGRVGTLSEFTMAIEEHVPVVVLNHTGGIAEHLEYILQIAKKEFPSNFILFIENAKTGVTKLLKHLHGNTSH